MTTELSENFSNISSKVHQSAYSLLTSIEKITKISLASFDQEIGDKKKLVNILLNDFTAISFLFGVCLKDILEDNAVDYMLKALNTCSAILANPDLSKAFAEKIWVET